MKVAVLGSDGYLGYACAVSLRAHGHEVYGVDTLFRREMCVSAIPVAGYRARAAANGYGFDVCDVGSADMIERLRRFAPDAIVHFAEIPAAPFSMKGRGEACLVQQNNVIGTLALLYSIREACPDAHLVKLGSMGEYGTPDCDIPEGEWEVEFRGRKVRTWFPRKAGSWYHLSKVHDSHNIRFACDMWGLRSTDIMQGVVFGSHIEEMGDDRRLRTRFDFDETFATIVNRFVCQAAIGMPLTVYGAGTQRRGMLPLRDSMSCIHTILEHPPEKGEYRTVNQFAQPYELNHVARVVAEVTGAKIQHVDNPRVEEYGHYYNPDYDTLKRWGYQPSDDLAGDVKQMFEDVLPHKKIIEANRDCIMPKTRWMA